MGDNKMKTKTDIMDLIRFVCDFYNVYREYLGLDHEEARYKVELTYDDLHDWVYEKGLFKKEKPCG